MEEREKERRRVCGVVAGWPGVGVGGVDAGGVDRARPEDWLCSSAGLAAAP